MGSELPNFIQPPTIEEAINSGGSETQAAQAKRKRGHPHTPETRAQMSETRKGKQLSPAHRAHISEGLKGREVSPETRTLLSAIQIGRDFSAEHKARLSEAAQKSWEKKKIRAKRSKKRSLQTGAFGDSYGPTETFL